MLNSPKSKRFVWALLTIVGIVVILISISIVRNNKEIHELQIRKINSDDPGDVVEVFIEALKNNDFDLAKDLVIPEQREHITKWITESNHKPFDCPNDWSLGIGAFIEPFMGGSNSYGDIKDEMTAVNSSIFCYNSGSSIKIEGAIVKYNGVNWKIIDWDQICTSSSEYDSPKICFP